MSIVRNILVRVGADLSDLQKELNNASKYMSKAGKELQKTGENLTKYVTLPIAAIGTVAVKAAADFEQGMANIKAVSGVTGKELEDLKKLAIDMGAKTKYSAKEAAAGIEELIKAGVGVKDILNGGLEGALNLAAAGELELADAAEIASTALNAFKADSLSVTQAADILAGAANASATDVTELKYGLSAASAVASGAGMTFKDTSTALAVFAQNGLKGSDAGTSLKTMLMNLQPQTDKQAELFKKLGLLTREGTSAFYDQHGKLRSLAEIAQILQNSMKGMTDAQRLATMETIFGSDAIRAANVLFKEGATGVNTMAAEMTKFTAAQVAAEKMNTLNGSIEQLRGSLETIGIQLGTIIIPIISQLVNEYLIPLVNWFGSLDAETQKQIVSWVALAAAIGPVILILGKVVSIIGMAIGFVKGIVAAFAAFEAGTVGIGGALTMVFGPGGVVLLVIAGIAALVAGVMYLWNTNEGFRNGVISIWESIKAAALTVFGYLQAWWAEWGGTIKQIFSDAWFIIYTIAIAVFDQLRAFWEQWGPLITALFKTHFDLLVAYFKFTWDTIKNTVEFALKLIGNLLGFWVDVFKGDWEGAWEHIKNIGIAIWDYITNQLTAVTNYWGNIFNAFKNNVMGIFDGIWNGIQGYIDKIVSGVTNALNTIKSLASFGGGGGGSGSGWSAVDEKKYYEDNKEAIDEIANSRGVDIGVATSIHQTEKHADGGIFTRPTLWGNHLIGEAGPEALMPLDRLDRMLNINASNDRPIVIYLDGKKIYEGVDSYLGSRLRALGG